MPETWTMTVHAVGPERLGVHPIGAWLIVALGLILASPTLAGAVRCTTSEERALGRWHTLCDDGTRAVTTWSSTRGGWQTTITESPQPSRTCRPHTTGHRLEVHCR